MTSHADVSVRIAWAEDAAGIAAVQLRAWRRQYADIFPTDLLSAEDFEEAWTTSLVTPKDARNRVLVALERNTIRGFAVTVPAADPDLDPIAVGELAELTVDPDLVGHGHGSRLLQACADTLRADRFSTAVTWLTTEDDVRRTFLTGAGWAADGAHRELDLAGDGSVRVKQVRLHTGLDAPTDPAEPAGAGG
jgi:GNAT superfamily N-acetyltransferase